MATQELIRISKSRFKSGEQCLKRTWLESHKPDLAAELSEAELMYIHQGETVGEFAHKLFPDGVLVEHGPEEREMALLKTQELLDDPSVTTIFEAAFEFQGSLVRVDALRRIDGSDSFELVEVKGAAHLTPEHIVDAAFQYYVLKNAGVDVRSVRLAHPNKEYVRPDENPIDPNEYFELIDVTTDAESLSDHIRARLTIQRATIQQEEAPEIDFSSHCNKPHRCPFWEHCHYGRTKHPITELNNLRPNQREILKDLDIWDVRDIPEGLPVLRELQQRIRDVVVSQEPYFDAEGFAQDLANIEYPLHFLDFEGFSPAIPVYPGTRPYETVLFQFSSHTMYENGRTFHREYLHADDTDPRERFARKLIKAMGDHGSIFVYSHYENTQLKKLQKYLSEKAAAKRESGRVATAERLEGYVASLENIRNRFVDLLPILKDRFYHPDQHGSYSIKAVLPIVAPELSYKDLEIQNGAVAASVYAEIIDPETPPARRAMLARNLLKYCERDTEAMLVLFTNLHPEWVQKMEAWKKGEKKRRQRAVAR